MRKIHIYILGIIVLGLGQGYLRSAVGHDGVAFAIVIAWLLLVRLVAERFGKP